MSLLTRRRASKSASKSALRTAYPPPLSPNAPSTPTQPPDTEQSPSGSFHAEGGDVAAEQDERAGADLQVEGPSAPVAPELLAQVQAVRDSFEKLSTNTAKAYSQDLEHFAKWRGLPFAEALGSLLKMPGADGVALVSSWDVAMLSSGASIATVKRRLSALRAFMREAAVRGLTDWVLEVDAPPARGFSTNALRYSGMLIAAHYPMRAYESDELPELFAPGEIACERFTSEP